MSIHPGTHIQSVHLTIADLDRSLAFYQERLGFRLHRRDGPVAALGAGVAVGSQAGARISHRLAGATLIRLLSAALALISVRLLVGVV